MLSGGTDVNINLLHWTPENWKNGPSTGQLSLPGSTYFCWLQRFGKVCFECHICISKTFMDVAYYTVLWWWRFSQSLPHFFNLIMYMLTVISFWEKTDICHCVCCVTCDLLCMKQIHYYCSLAKRLLMYSIWMGVNNSVEGSQSHYFTTQMLSDKCDYHFNAVYSILCSSICCYYTH